MPTHPAAFAAVASGLAGVSPHSPEAVETFYLNVFPRYGDEAKALVLDWLTAAVESPLEDDIAALVEAVKGGPPQAKRRARSRSILAGS
ncbi:hypothetical protein [Methylobacterium sp. Leaf118]|uniref:hypothetical protein n=1 Tax=Methylobacterium sp. Leaf118 TaxID=2876562 RepID=UPI001E598C5D|nr:hypothetical protein [Methylobacterium sp. Leaf118]